MEMNESSLEVIEVVEQQQSDQSDPLFSLPILSNSFSFPSQYSCSLPSSDEKVLNNFHFRGTALGGRVDRRRSD